MKGLTSSAYPGATLLVGIVVALFALAACPFPGHAAETAGEKDFEEICSLTSDAGSLSVAELKDLIARADRLVTVLEGWEEPRRTVYLKRLKMCRALFVYVLESKEGGNNVSH